MKKEEKKVIPMCWKCANKMVKKEGRNNVLSGCKLMTEEDFKNKEEKCPVVVNYEEHKDLQKV